MVCDIIAKVFGVLWSGLLGGMGCVKNPTETSLARGLKSNDMKTK